MNEQDKMITQDENGVINNQYANENDTSQYATSPNTTTVAKDSKTGSGIDAALGTEYSWDTKASERANLDYEAAVLESKSNYLTNRQELESQGQQLQQQADMQKYSQNQSNEKAGWTGGYILDTERQMAYLKQTIQSQMYGQMELQKYGYDTSLAAARLAYDTNKYDLALEYYNTALQRAVTEADITGYYVAPEVTEMLNEYSIASSILNAESGYSDEERERADKVIASVYEWFEANGISKEGVMTMSKYESERDWNQSILDSFEYIDETTHQITGDKFIQYGADGKPVYSEDGTSVNTINFKTMTTEEITEYIKINDICREQFYGYMDNKITGELVTQFEDYCIANKQMTKNEDGTYSPIEGVDYENLVYRYLNSSDSYEKLKEKLGIDDTGMSRDFQHLIENYDFTINLPDGSTLSTTFKELEEGKASVPKLLGNMLTKDGDGNYTKTFTTTEDFPSGVKIKGKDTGGNTVVVDDKGSKVFFSDMTAWDDGKDNKDGDWDGESDLAIYSKDGDEFSSERGGWELEIKNTNALDSTTTETLNKAYYDTHNGQAIQNGTVVFYGGKMLVFAHNTYREVGGQCGNDTYKTIIREVKEKTGA